MKSPKHVIFGPYEFEIFCPDDNPHYHRPRSDVLRITVHPPHGNPIVIETKGVRRDANLLKPCPDLDRLIRAGLYQLHTFVAENFNRTEVL